MSIRNTLQQTALHCNTQHVNGVSIRNTLQQTALHCNAQHVNGVSIYSTLHHIATHCNTLPTHSSTLQHTPNTLQHTPAHSIQPLRLFIRGCVGEKLFCLKQKNHKRIYSSWNAIFFNSVSPSRFLACASSFYVVRALSRVQVQSA